MRRVCTYRKSRQLFADVQHDAVHVLQHQRPLHDGFTQRLQLLAVDAAADDANDGPGHRHSDTRLHQSLFCLRSTHTGRRVHWSHHHHRHRHHHHSLPVRWSANRCSRQCYITDNCNCNRKGKITEKYWFS